MTASHYEPPRADLLLEAAPPQDAELAGHGQRFGTFLIDGVVRSFLASLAGRALASSIDPGLAGFAHSWVVATALSTLYFVSLEFASGRTLGKLVMGTRVIAATGGAPTFAQLLGRSLSRFVPFEPFSFLGEQPIGWHDKWSRTRVVRTRGPRRTLQTKPLAG
jgi:uncharacterized RDD family membrane protein YckC